MRYKVVFMKLDELSRNGSELKPPDRDVLIGSPERKLRQPESMIIVKTKDNFVERKNAINKMVNTETPEDFRENDQKETFQYQVPRVRASFTLKVAPDSTTADLPESTVESNASNERNASANTYGSKLSSSKASLPEKEPHLPDINSVVPNKPVRDFTSCVPAQPAIINVIPKAPKPILANRSTHNVTNDDKDFEIPLEESLKAVEDFIKREKELSKWHIEEDVLAKWKGNGLYYKAKIMDIFPSGMVVILFDSYDITEEVNYKDLCKFFKKTSNFKKKGRPLEKLTIDTEKKNKICAKKQSKAKKRRIPCKRLRFVSAFKKSDMVRKKLLLSYRKKSRNLPMIKKSKKRAQKPTVIKKSS